MQNTISRDPDFLAITVDEAKQWCRIDADNDDALIAGLIATATGAAESYTGRTIVPSTLEFSFDEGDKRYVIPTAPVIAISDVELMDAEGVKEALPMPDSYWVLLRDSGAVLTLAGGMRGCRTLVLTCEAGYATPDEIPAPIKQAIAVHVGSFYANREGQDAAAATFQHLLNPFRVGVL
jgi:uncharacterized phiE125 gp8 family phage protein